MGIDGGGTQTRAVILDDDGHLLGHGQAGPSNPNAVGLDQSLVALKGAMAGACDGAEVKLDNINSIFLGLSGLPRIKREDFKKT